MKVHLHIGTHKTGSTTLQNFCRKNRETLRRHGVDYPDSRTTFAGHHNLFWEWAAPQRFDPAGIRWDGLQRELATSDARCAIVSSEDFCRAEPAIVERIRERLAAHDCSIVVYLRRQDKLLQSMYAHDVKIGEPVGSFDAFTARSLQGNAHDYRLLTERWSEVFGSERMGVRPFESAGFRGGDLIGDFLAGLGLEAERREFATIPAVNRAPGAKTLAILKALAERLDRSALGPDAVRTFYTLPVLRSAERTGPGGPLNLLDRRRSEAILAAFETSNRFVARQYLGRERLFEEPLADDAVDSLDLAQVTPEEWLGVLQGVLEEGRTRKVAR